VRSHHFPVGAERVAVYSTSNVVAGGLAPGFEEGVPANLAETPEHEVVKEPEIILPALPHAVPPGQVR